MMMLKKKNNDNNVFDVVEVVFVVAASNFVVIFSVNLRIIASTSFFFIFISFHFTPKSENTKIFKTTHKSSQLMANLL